jgi:valyl-tRNA synthetase
MSPGLSAATNTRSTSALQILHPLAPFITEEIYQRLREFRGDFPESISISSYPGFNEDEVYEEAYDEIEFIKQVIVAIRNLRATVGVHPSNRVNIILVPDSKTVLETIKRNEISILSLAKASTEFSKEAKPKKAIAQVIGSLQIFLPVEGLIDVQKEVERIKREISNLTKSLEFSKRKLSSLDFLERAPEEVVEKEKEKYEEISLKKQKMEEVLEKLGEIR